MKADPQKLCDAKPHLYKEDGVWKLAYHNCYGNFHMLAMARVAIWYKNNYGYWPSE